VQAGRFLNQVQDRFFVLELEGQTYTIASGPIRGSVVGADLYPPTPVGTACLRTIRSFAASGCWRDHIRTLAGRFRDKKTSSFCELFHALLTAGH